MLMVRHMPQDIIFFDGPKFPMVPYRWAPATFKARPSTMVDPSPHQQRVECTAQGLYDFQYFLLLADVQQGIDDTTHQAVDTSKSSVYGVYWDPDSQNIPATFNAVIVRPIEEGRYLKLESEQVAEAIGVRRHPDATEIGEFRSEYAGTVTISKLHRAGLATGTRFTEATWYVERVSIS